MPTCLITGAARGIGREFVRQYAADNWTVVGTIRNSTDAAALSALKCRTELVDLADTVAIGELGRRLGSIAIDVLICNAGLYEGRDKRLEDIEVDAIVSGFAVNVVAPVLLAKILMPNVKRSEQKKMVAISSLMATRNAKDRPGHLVYRSSKAALNHAWNALALEEPDIIPILLRPGLVSTRMTNFNGELSCEQSVSGMRQVITRAGREARGQYYDYTGALTEW
jgi:NAD(P)-dependent dehydrogenase (short-subunit alcohol dehydrogenase family)